MDSTRKKLLIGSHEEWTFEKVNAVTRECDQIAQEELELERFPLQVEIVGSEQMIDALTSVGMPIGYPHWSFGKRFTQISEYYKKGLMGLAYEIVINSDPCIAYCMEDNTMVMQALVIAHAGSGHNAFFKNNHLFKGWTRPSAILDYLAFAKDYIARCEEKHGLSEVERTLDACHALMSHGIDRFTRPQELSLKKEKERQKERVIQQQKEVNILWSTVPQKKDGKKDPLNEVFPKEPEENILYFVEKYAPELPQWKREIIRIVRKIAQYFYPQRQTQVLNEGFACFVHYYTMYSLWEKEMISDGAMQEFFSSHTTLIFQPPFNSPRYSGINVYALGFKMFMDIRRMCENPTDEDREWFPDVVGRPWLEMVKYIAFEFRDNSAILQIFSPRLMREFGFFCFEDDSDSNFLKVTAIPRDRNDGYKHVQKVLASQFDLNLQTPSIKIVNVDKRGDRTLTLHHMAIDDQPMHSNDTEEVVEHLAYLWEFPVALNTEVGGKTESFHSG